MPAEDYVGKPGHEKKFHKTHFQGLKKTWKSTPSKNEWVKVGAGKFILLPKKQDNPDSEANDDTIKHSPKRTSRTRSI